MTSAYTRSCRAQWNCRALEVCCAICCVRRPQSRRAMSVAASTDRKLVIEVRGSFFVAIGSVAQLRTLMLTCFDRRTAKAEGPKHALLHPRMHTSSPTARAASRKRKESSQRYGLTCYKQRHWSSSAAFKSCFVQFERTIRVCVRECTTSAHYALVPGPVLRGRH